MLHLALDFDSEMKAASESSDKEKTYELPDGNIITVGSERFPLPGSPVPAKLPGQGGQLQPQWHS